MESELKIDSYDDILEKKLSILGIKRDELPAWVNNPVKDVKDIKNIGYYKLVTQDIPKVKIPTSQIVGTMHESYYKETWLKMLINLHRITVKTREEAINVILNERIL